MTRRFKLFIALGLAVALLLILVDATLGNAQMDAQINAYRAAHGRPPLTTSTFLTTTAMARAKTLSANRAAGLPTLVHDTSWGPKSGCTGWGENIAYRVPAASDPVAWAMYAFENSPAHNSNLLGNWTRVGTAVYIGYQGGEYVAQLFASGCDGTAPQPTPKPVTTTKPKVYTRPAVTSTPHYLPNTAYEAPK